MYLRQYLITSHATFTDHATAFGLLVRKYIFKISVLTSQMQGHSHALHTSNAHNLADSPSKGGLSRTINRQQSLGVKGSAPFVHLGQTQTPATRIDFGRTSTSYLDSMPRSAAVQRDSKAAARAELDVSQSALAEVTQELQLKRRDLCTAQSSIETLSKRLALTTWRGEALQARAEEGDAAQAELKRALQQLYTAQAMVMKQEEQMADTQAANMEQQKELAEALSSAAQLQAQLDARQAALEAAGGSASAATAQLQVQAEHIKQLMQQIKEQSDVHSRDVALRGEEATSLREELATAQAALASVTEARDNLVREVETSSTAGDVVRGSMLALQEQLDAQVSKTAQLEQQLSTEESKRRAAALDTAARMVAHSLRARARRSLAASFQRWRGTAATLSQQATAKAQLQQVEQSVEEHSQQAAHARKRSAELEAFHGEEAAQLKQRISDTEREAQATAASLQQHSARARGTAMKAVVRMLRHREAGGDWQSTAARVAFLHWRSAATASSEMQWRNKALVELRSELDSSQGELALQQQAEGTAAGTPVWPLAVYSALCSLALLAAALLLTGFTGHLDMWLVGAPAWLSAALTAAVGLLSGLLSPGAAGVDAGACAPGSVPQWHGLPSLGAGMLECTEL